MYPSIKRCIQIYGGSLKPCYPWIISDIQTVDGVDFVRIQKTDNGLHRFVTGGHKQNGGLKDTPFLDDLKKKRNIAMITASEEPTIFGNNITPSNRKRRVLIAAQKNVDQPLILTLELPAVECDVGEAAAISMKLRAPMSDMKAEGVEVELTSANLHYIRIALRAGIGHKSGGRSKPGEPSHSACRWVKRRKVEGYLASRMEEGRQVSKFFHSLALDPCDVRVLADRWRSGEGAEGCEVEDVEDAETPS
jgi:hypothetical protein